MADEDFNFRVWLREEGCEKYKEARRLTDEESQNDPTNEPFKSKYAARNILSELKAKLESFETHEDEPLSDNERSSQLKHRMAVLDYQIGVNYIETEELSTGEEHLLCCLKRLEGDRLNKQCCNLVVNLLNQLGILWSHRGEAEKAKQYLQDAEKLYHTFKKEVGGAPLGLHELFYPEEQLLSEHEREIAFDHSFTHSLYYLAQVYNSQGDSKKAAEYCHTTLLRQLETGKYEPVDWAVNCATLSQYYLTKGNYNMSRHCLACSSRVFAEAEEKEIIEPVLDEDSEEEKQKKERIPHRKADIARCWSKYCLDLLKTSKEQRVSEMSSEEDTEAEECSNTQSEECIHGETSDGRTHGESEVLDTEDIGFGLGETEKDPLRFESLEVTSIEQTVTSERLKDYEQARLVFLEGQRWLNKAKEYYVLDGHVTDHIEIVQDMSQLFKYLAFFENDFERRCKMHKRRADMLNDVLIELNPQHYLMVCRQLTFEIGEIYNDMVDLKVAIQEESGHGPTPHSMKKINHLVDQSIKYFQGFIDSLKSKGSLPKTFEETLVRPALVAHFYIARLLAKKICANKQAKVENIKKGLDLYQYTIDYCQSHPDMPNVFEEELRLAQEFVALLPIKMDKIMMGQY